MSADTEQRKLAAIMFTDMVGYSALSQRDEKLAQELLEEHRRLLRPIFPRFNGTEIKTIGDAFLIEFNSALEAAECAIEIQRALAHRNHDVTAERRIELRIGIHIGDVVHRTGDVYGDGVNIASRIEQLANAGGICVSMDVERHTRNALEARFEKLAPTELKNISVPMDLFRIVLPWERDTQLKPERQRPVAARRSIPVGWLVAAALLLVMIAGWFLAGRYKMSTKQSAVADVPTKSIAVLPFENLSRDPDNAYFADGTQNEILTKLAGIGDLKVISRTSTAKYKSKPEDLKRVAYELGVTTVLEGSVQKAGDIVRVNVQLIDARADTHLWAKSYDRHLRDIFVVESEVAEEIAQTLRAKLSPSEANSVGAAPTNDTEAYDLFLKGEYQELQAESAENPELYNRAQTFYRQALARDPNFALAYARLAWGRMQQHWFSHRLNSAQLEEVKSNIERALAIAPELAEAYLALGVYHYWGHLDYDSALKALDRAIELQPSNSNSRTLRAAVYRRRGEWRRSLAESERALELNPRDSLTHTDIGDTYLTLRRWSDAERALTRALALDPHNINAGFHLAQTYVNSTGDISRARQAWEGIPDNKTGFSPYGIVISQTISETAYLDVLERRFADALKVWDTVPMNTPDARLRQLDARVGIQMMAGQSGTAKSEAEQARPLLEARLAEQVPGDPTSLTESAWVYVCQGRNDDALRIAREAAEALPIEKDALVGTYFLTGLAQIDAHTGRPEEAIKILGLLLTIPAGEYISVARLKIDPVWDPIRNDPGFQKLLSEPEPETVYN